MPIPMTALGPLFSLRGLAMPVVAQTLITRGRNWKKSRNSGFERSETEQHNQQATPTMMRGARNDL